MPANVFEPPTHDRIREHTRPAVNQRIDRMTRGAIEESADSPTHIRQRLSELDREWHVDRALMAMFSMLGAFTAHNAMHDLARGRRISGWRLIFWTQMGFLAYHAFRGWCPPVALLRRMGFRSADEIGAERVALTRLER